MLQQIELDHNMQHWFSNTVVKFKFSTKCHGMNVESMLLMTWLLLYVLLVQLLMQVYFHARVLKG